MTLGGGATRAAVKGGAGGLRPRIDPTEGHVSTENIQPFARPEGRLSDRPSDRQIARRPAPNLEQAAGALPCQQALAPPRSLLTACWCGRIEGERASNGVDPLGRGFRGCTHSW